MPEGVEVKLSAETIRPLVEGKQIGHITVSNKSRYAASMPDGMKEFLASYYDTSDKINIVNECKVVSVKTHGKFMYWEFSNGWYMFSTFGMTGQWSPKEGKHVCLGIRLYDYDSKEISNIYFNDPRHFGTIKFLKGKFALMNKLADLGWDPLQNNFDEYRGWLMGQLLRSSKPIGQILLDQSFFSGVGNYIRAEALYLAKVSPWKSANLLSKDEVNLLCQSCIDVMQESYKYQGATIQTYKTVYGEEGKYSSLFKIYGKKTDPLGNKVIKENTPDGRTIHWCPAVQK